jgi:hypothetical protein
MAIEFIVFLIVVVPSFWAAIYALVTSERLTRFLSRWQIPKRS